MSWRTGVHLGLGFGHEARDYVEGKRSEDPARPFESKGIQNFLPEWLRTYGGKNPKFSSGMQSGTENLADLFRNPGGLGSNIASAIAPRVAMESEAINRNTQGQLSQAQGAMARSGSGGGFAQALAASIQQAGARQQADTTRTAMSESAQLRRQDLSRLMETYRMLLEFTNAGRQTLAGQQQIRQQTLAGSREGAQAAGNMIGNIVSSIGGGMS